MCGRWAGAMAGGALNSGSSLEWLSWREMSAPLSAGLAPSHHRRWSVRVLPPLAGQPRGWYEEFVAPWQAYLEVMARPRGSRPLSLVSPSQLARVRPGLAGGDGEEMPSRPTADGDSGSVAGSGRASPARKRRRLVSELGSVGGSRTEGSRGLVRASSPTGLPPAKRRQGTLAGWVRVGDSGADSSSSTGRGAAVTGCGRAEPSAPT